MSAVSFEDLSELEGGEARLERWRLESSRDQDVIKGPK